jgi:hypothetical protein
MKLLHLFKSFSADGFAKIQGYEDIKDIVRRALDSDENYNLLFVGTPASSKTLFLQGGGRLEKTASILMVQTLQIES